MDRNDGWFESEQSTRVALIREVQRIRRRIRTRKLQVIALAAVFTGLISYKLLTRKHVVESEVVLALNEGSLSAKKNGIPVDDLRDYVANVLMPNDRLASLIEKHHLFKIRKAFSMEDAINELREAIEIEIWRNSFVYYDEDAQNPEHSARIGITYADTDPVRATAVAHDLGDIVVREGLEVRKQIGNSLSESITNVRDELGQRIRQLQLARAEKLQQQKLALHDGKRDLARALELGMFSLDQELKVLQKDLYDIAGSRDIVAGAISAAGLDMTLAIVEERPADLPEQHYFATILIIVVIGVGSFLGSALLIGAFDSRVHDTEDVERLGLPIVGHVPGFPGDGVGSLAVRGASRRRVPSFQRWLLHR